MRLNFILILLLINFSSFAQIDSLHRNHFSANIASALISGEAGLYYDIKYSDKLWFEFSYAHRFHNLTIIMNGGEGSDYKLWAQTGDIARTGIKSFYKSKNKYSLNSPYVYCRAAYWNIHTPKYTTRHGSNGLGSTLREVVSDDRNFLNLSLGFGKISHLDDHIYADLFLLFGVGVGEKKTHKYTHGGSNPGEFIYPENTFVKSSYFTPTIDIGVNIGFCW